MKIYRNRLKKRTELFSLFFLLLILLLLVGYFFLLPSSQKDLSSPSLDPSLLVKNHETHQRKSAVQKDLWLAQSHFCLTSNYSDLFSSQKLGSTRIMEKLERVQCWVQAETSFSASCGYPFHYLTANQGTFFFPSHQFVLSDQVQFYSFSVSPPSIPSDVDLSQALWKGKAKEMVFYLKDNQPECKAQDFQVEMVLQENRIKAPVAYWNFQESSLFFDHPQGSLRSFTSSAQEPLEFAANSLQANLSEGTFLLKDNVVLDQFHFGHLETDQVQLWIPKDKNASKKLKATGKTIFFLTKKNGSLTCDGTIESDQQLLTATAGDPEGSPITFEDEEISIFAHKSTVQLNPRTSKIERISMEEEVLLMVPKTTPPTFGKADRVSYFPATKELLLSSAPNQKVFLWQENHGLCVTAPELLIQHLNDPEKRKIEGKGDVQFSLTPEEEDLLRKLFSKYVKK